jgi:mxaJ protein
MRPSCSALAPLALLLSLSAARAEEFRVCADPGNLPYSNSAGEGFENKLAELLAQEFGQSLAYEWHRQGRGFVRNTLKAGKCDVRMSAPVGYDLVDTTRPYYRSAYVFVARKDRGLDIHSIRDPRLHSLTIGVPILGDNNAAAPPALALAQLGVVDNVRGFMVHGPSDPIDAVLAGDIDIAAVWGPTLGRRDQSGLTIAPIEDAEGFAPLRFAFDIALGVRKGDEQRRNRLNQALTERAEVIQGLLRAYGLPLVAEGGGR